MATPSSLVRLIGVPLDLGAGRRGVDMGPSAMRIAGATQTLERLGYEVIDDGDIAVVCPEVQEVSDPKLRYLPEIMRTVENLSGKVERTMGRGEFPVVLGGDHSMAIGTISGAASHYRGEGKKMGFFGSMLTVTQTPRKPRPPVISTGCRWRWCWEGGPKSSSRSAALVLRKRGSILRMPH